MRIAVGIEYDGTSYFGWQKQLNLPTIQNTLEIALGRVACQPVHLTVAGRTDAGVHAIEQVAHFDTTNNRPINAWVFGTNTYLPKDIKVLWARPVADDFHARFSATARSYKYLIINRRIPPALQQNRAMWYPYNLSEKLIQEGANYLLGENDFTSFRGSGCQSKTPNRCVKSINVIRNDELITIEIKANAFLLHMVRNIVGVLLEIGEGKKSPEWAKQVLEAKNRNIAGITAPPQGLYLVKVDFGS